MRGWVAGALVAALAGCGGGVRGDGNIQKQTREVGEFRRVAVGQGLHAHVAPGSPAKVTVEGDANLLALLEIDARDGTLQTRVKGDQSLRPTRPIELDVTTPALEGVSATAGAEVDATATPASAFAIEASAGARVKVDGVRADRVTLAASAGSDVTVAGEARTVVVTASAGSHVRALDLTAQEAALTGNAGADIDVRATQRVGGALSSGTDARIAGNPAAREITTSSGADVAYEP
jgi:hypothetical protein